MVRHKDWFSVDKEKRAARVRNSPLPFILREALANSLDATARNIEVVFGAAEGTRLNREGNRAFTLMCADDGCGCDDPEIIRRVGSSTSDLHPEKRGRFGQGLIDILAICDEAEIVTGGNRIRFDHDGCRISKVRRASPGLTLSASLRHGGEGIDELPDYFAGLILPDGVRVSFNGIVVQQRTAIRQILDIPLPTVAYDPDGKRIRHRTRPTAIGIYDRHSVKPMIHELGIPVDVAPWELPYDIDVRQKTPLDMERCMLPDVYKDKVISALVGPMSDLYQSFMNVQNRVPVEILHDGSKATQLSDAAKQQAAQTVYERPLSEIGRRNPFDPQDRSRSQELEAIGVLPVTTAHAPEGMREILRAAPTIEQLHDDRCKVHFTVGVLPDVTERESLCMSVFREIASALLGRDIPMHRFQAAVGRQSCGIQAVYRRSDGSIGLNILVDHLWREPIGPDALGVLVHECAHEAVEGHGIDFQREIERLAGKLAVWVGSHPDRWRHFIQFLSR